MLKWRKWRADRPAPGRTADEGVISDMRIEIQQLRSIINIVGAPPVPPKHLQERVVGGYYADWWESGEALLCSMDQCLRGVRKSIRDFSCILDFGCGPGRVTVPARYYLDEDTEIHATDIDREAISWCCENYGKIASFQANDIDPPFRYSENMFDFCYSISIFTHLPEDMQLRWLAELHRVTKPGGFLILTINTESRFRAMEEQKYVPIVKGKEGGGFLYVAGDTTEGLPDFYRSTYHLHSYIMDVWSSIFQVIEIYDGVISNGHLDAVLVSPKKGGSLK